MKRKKEKTYWVPFRYGKPWDDGVALVCYITKIDALEIGFKDVRRVQIVEVKK